MTRDASRLDEFAQCRKDGLSVRDAARAIGLSERSGWHYAKALQSREVQAGVKNPPVPAVPEGFEVRQVSTTLNPDGSHGKQHIQARLESARDIEAVPEGHVVKGLSTLLDETGGVRAQWVKTSLDAERRDLAQRAALEAMVEQLPPFDLVAAPAQPASTLAVLMTMTDCHVGMLAWGRETMGEPWDLEIAERTLTTTFMRMIDAAPSAALFILNQLGDFLHFDSLTALTPASGHVLDADSRYQKIVQAAVRILERIILHALAKFERLHVFMNEGNHDPAGSVWLRVMFARLFRDNPRVQVELGPNPYQVVKWGRTMICVHHGHLAKWEKLPSIFAAQYARIWGETDHRYAHTGHYHEEHTKEYPGMTVMQHPTIASPDAYAARNGYMSKRQAMLITYSSEHGEVERATFLPAI